MRACPLRRKSRMQASVREGIKLCPGDSCQRPGTSGSIRCRIGGFHGQGDRLGGPGDVAAPYLVTGNFDQRLGPATGGYDFQGRCNRLADISSPSTVLRGDRPAGHRARVRSRYARRLQEPLDCRLRWPAPVRFRRRASYVRSRRLSLPRFRMPRQSNAARRPDRRFWPALRRLHRAPMHGHDRRRCARQQPALRLWCAGRPTDRRISAGFGRYARARTPSHRRRRSPRPLTSLRPSSGRRPENPPLRPELRRCQPAPEPDRTPPSLPPSPQGPRQSNVLRPQRRRLRPAPWRAHSRLRRPLPPCHRSASNTISPGAPPPDHSPAPMSPSPEREEADARSQSPALVRSGP